MQVEQINTNLNISTQNDEIVYPEKNEEKSFNSLGRARRRDIF